MVDVATGSLTAAGSASLADSIVGTLNATSQTVKFTIQQIHDARTVPGSGYILGRYTSGTGPLQNLQLSSKFTTTGGVLDLASVSWTSQLDVIQTSGNGMSLIPTAAGGTPSLAAAGADTNITLKLVGKGSGGVSLWTSGVEQARAIGSASSVNYMTFAGAAGGSPVTLSAAGSSTDVGITVSPKGAGSFNATATTGNAVLTSGTNVLTLSPTTVTMNFAGGNFLLANGSNAVVLGSGEASTTTVGGTLRGPSGSGTNITGGTVTIAGGASTGNVAGGSIVFKTSPASGSSGTTANTLTNRLVIDSTGALIVGSGEASASPVGNTIRATVATGTNIAGSTLTIQGGQSTGSGTAGPISFKVSPSGGAGAGLNALVERLKLDNSGLTLTGATNITGGTHALTGNIVFTGSQQNEVPTTGGTSTAYTLTTANTLAALANGQRQYLKINADCGANPTLNVDGKGAKNMVKFAYSGGAYTNLQAFDVRNGQIIEVVYDSTADKYVVLSPIDSRSKVLIKRQTVSAGTSSNATWTTGAFRAIEIDIYSFTAITTAGSVYMRFSTDGGSTYISTSSYAWTWAWWFAASGSVSTQTQTEMLVTGLCLANDARNNVHMHIDISSGTVRFHSGYVDGTPQWITMTGYGGGPANLNGILLGCANAGPNTFNADIFYYGVR